MSVSFSAMVVRARSVRGLLAIGAMRHRDALHVLGPVGLEIAENVQIGKIARLAIIRNFVADGVVPSVAAESTQQRVRQ